MYRLKGSCSKQGKEEKKKASFLFGNSFHREFGEKKLLVLRFTLWGFFIHYGQKTYGNVYACFVFQNDEAWKDEAGG